MSLSDVLHTARRFTVRQESGQAIILVAVLGAALMGVTGMAVEGGRMLVEYRQMQLAADMAALIGAQDAGCTSTDTACIANARHSACDSAYQNGYGGGWDSGTSTCLVGVDSTVTIDIPPTTCSPYNVDYGNNKTPSNNCNATTTASRYNYIEVSITHDLGTIPIFNVHVTPFAHAVARRGSHSPRDFAIAVLDPSLSKALSLSGSKTGGQVYVVGSIMSNSSAADSINTGGQSLDYACGGQWFTASTSETTAPGNLNSYQVGGAYFSPPGCTGTKDSSVAWNWGQNAIPDPYSTVNPPPTSSTWTNCTPCGSAGHYYHWTNSQGRIGGKWDDNGAGAPGSSGNNDNYELFPGQYPSGITATGGNVYLNPGVYNLGTSGLKISGQANICVFGAPICDRFSGTSIPGTSQTCGSASMDSTSTSYVAPATWYYYCSSWGTWDTSPPSGTNGISTGIPSSLSTSIPRFTNNTSVTSRAMNGVTFYTYSSGSYQTGGQMKITGGGVESLAFPNPCPGTGTSTTTSVPFQSNMGTGDSGAAGAVYTYSSSSVASALGSSPAGILYPSADLTVGGEVSCRAALNGGDASGSIPDVWPGEFQSTTSGQLLHFLFFMRDKTAAIDLEGSGTQLWWGILYNPGDFASAGGCGSATSGCQIKLAGSSGGSGDLPMILGQVIGDGVSIGGSATIEVFYRPCDPRTTNCTDGPGSTLVQ